MRHGDIRQYMHIVLVENSTGICFVILYSFDNLCLLNFLKLTRCDQTAHIAVIYLFAIFIDIYLK